MKSRYTMYGYVVSKFGIPLAKKALKKKVKDAPRQGAQAANQNRAKASVLIGSALGAIAYVAKRRRGGSSHE